MTEEWKELICAFCKWYHIGVGVCTNADSKHCADLMSRYNFCTKWEHEDEDECQKNPRNRRGIKDKK